MKNLTKVIKIVFIYTSLFVAYCAIVIIVGNYFLSIFIPKQALENVLSGAIGAPFFFFIIWLFKKVKFELSSETEKKDLLEKLKQIDAEKEKEKRYANMSASMIRREKAKNKET